MAGCQYDIADQVARTISQLRKTENQPHWQSGGGWWVVRSPHANNKQDNKSDLRPGQGWIFSRMFQPWDNFSLNWARPFTEADQEKCVDTMEQTSIEREREREREKRYIEHLFCPQMSYLDQSL